MQTGGDQRGGHSHHLSTGTQAGRDGQGKHWVSWACQLRSGGRGTLPSQPTTPLCPATVFPFFTSSASLSHLFTLPKYAQAVIMGPESSHTHRLPLVSAPSQPQARPTEPPASPANGSQMAAW
ncbi:unnamed protein product [Pipistrellus nathusii]|uniref:Uncharacterized protein n=1 Tax=Pipistrellus nathusii TaxID=59473 RepID=A0ABN9ZFI9_PIPNA